MIKNISTLLILFSTIITYGQSITLLKNTHPKARELKHNLNAAKDSLILDSETKSIKVEIFNEDYEKSLVVEGFETQISLKDMPRGEFVVEAKLADKIIIINLINYNNRDELIDSDEARSEKVEEGKGMMLDEKQNRIKTSPNNSIEFILTRSKIKNQSQNNQKFYWVVTKINTESGSSKTMRLVNKKSADRMILKHKLELNSATSRLNELLIWEVYNTTKFMEQQTQNPDFFNSLTSDLFNTTPYFATHNKVVNL